MVEDGYGKNVNTENDTSSANKEIDKDVDELLAAVDKFLEKRPADGRSHTTAGALQITDGAETLRRDLKVLNLLENGRVTEEHEAKEKERSKSKSKEDAKKDEKAPKAAPATKAK